MKRIFFLLITISLFLTSCKKDSSTNQITNGTVLDSIVGIYNGHFEYGLASGGGDILYGSKLAIYKTSEDLYKVQVSNIVEPYSFQISSGQKIDNKIVFNIQSMLYLSGPMILKGDKTFTVSGQLYDVVYDLSTKEISYGLQIDSSSNFYAYHRGYYTKN